MPNQLQVGYSQALDGQVMNQRGGSFGETIVQQYNGKYAEAAHRGLTFVYNTPGQALLLSATTGNVPTIWNPAGSGRIAYVLQLSLAWLSGANVAGSVLLALTPNTGSAIGTGNPIVTFTQVAQVSAGNPAANSVLRFSPSANTFTAAPTVIANTGFNLAATQPTGLLQQDYDGAIAIYPGNAISLVYSVTTSTALFYATALISEVPLT